MSKLSLIAALALGGLLACSTLATAQDAPKNGKGGKKGMTVEQQMTRLTEQLTLTDEQKPKVQKVLEATSKKMTEIRNDSSLDQQARRDKMRPIMEEQNKEMKKILTEEQFKKYEEMNARRGKKAAKKTE
jgi:periplasmic protein CpxP/Spy